MTTKGSSFHLLMTTDAIGGVWHYALDLSAGLAEQGHRVTLALLGPSPSETQRADAERLDLRLIETGLPLDWLSDGPGPIAEAAEALARLAKIEMADIVQCNMPSLAGAASFPCPVIAAAHGCVSTWWDAAHKRPLDPSFRWHHLMTRRGLLAADAAVAPSASFAATLRDCYHLPELPIVVHNGRRHTARQVEHDRPIQAALTVGRLWDKVKNAAVLDRAAARIDAPILAAGALRGPHGEEFTPGAMHALGFMDEAGLASLLGSRPVFVSAATFEPFGLAVLEAAASGCALVLSDIDTFRELWDGAALFVPPGDDAGFAAAIQMLLRDPAQRAAMGESARRRAQGFTPAGMIRGMTEVYAAARRHEAAA